MVFGNPFVLNSANLDATVDPAFADAAGLAAKIGPSFASVEGTLIANRTVVGCEPDPVLCGGGDAIGNVAERRYTFALDCSQGFPCAGTAVTQFVTDEVLNTEQVPVTFDGHTLSWALDYTNAACLDASGASTGQGHSVIKWTLTPSDAAVIDGRYVVTGGTGTAEAFFELTDLTGCTGDLRASTQYSEIEVTGRE